MSFSKVYPAYINKAERKGRSKKEVDEIILWFTGYSPKELEDNILKETSIEDFFKNAKLNQNRRLIKGVVCGVRVEDIKEPIMREVRYLDKLIDELAHGKEMTKILRTPIEEE